MGDSVTSFNKDNTANSVFGEKESQWSYLAGVSIIWEYAWKR